MKSTHAIACSQAWPALDYNSWSDTLKTVHMWTQIVGKIRLSAMPWQNHSWHTSLYISANGLTTGSIPFKDGIFEIEFDFSEHQLVIRSSFENDQLLPLKPMSVATFYKDLFGLLNKIDIDISIYSKPNEIEEAIPFYENEKDCSYDKAMIVNYWQAAIHAHNIFIRFRSDFIGKCSPVHFFWGAFDIAVTRFSGRKAPLHQGSMPNMPKEVMQEAYSQEVISCGFWPGNDIFPKAAFYAYAYPSPEFFGEQPVQPSQAFWSNEMGEFFLLYDDVRNAEHPGAMLMQFLQSTYNAAATLGNWDRPNLEK